jgi:hypothetical protein
MFTIEVLPKKADEEFSILDLEFFHKECNGGKIKASKKLTDEVNPKENPNYFVFQCQRCFEDIDIYKTSTWLVCATAVDGQPRDINVNFDWKVERREIKEK